MNKNKNKRQRNYVSKLFNGTFKEISTIFEDEIKEKYIEGVLLLSSLIEDNLRILIQDRFAFSKYFDKLSLRTVKEIEDYSNNLSFYQKNRIALLVSLINDETYKNLESFRKKRNKWIHGFNAKSLCPTPHPIEIYKLSTKILEVLIKKSNYYGIMF